MLDCPTWSLNVVDFYNKMYSFRYGVKRKVFILRQKFPKYQNYVNSLLEWAHST